MSYSYGPQLSAWVPSAQIASSCEAQAQPQQKSYGSYNQFGTFKIAAGTTAPTSAACGAAIANQVASAHANLSSCGCGPAPPSCSGPPRRRPHPRLAAYNAGFGTCPSKSC